MINFNILDPNDFHNLESKEEKEKYIQKIKEAIKNTDNEIIKKMANIVKRNVKHYQNDFYVYDLHMIKKYTGPFLWMTRETGTDFIPLKHLKGALIDFYNYVKYTNEHFYLYDGHRLKKISFEEMEKLVDQHKKLLTS